MWYQRALLLSGIISLHVVIGLPDHTAKNCASAEHLTDFFVDLPINTTKITCKENKLLSGLIPGDIFETFSEADLADNYRNTY